MTDTLWSRACNDDKEALALIEATTVVKELDFGGPKPQPIAFCARCKELRDCLSGSDLCSCTEEQLLEWLATGAT